MHWWPTELGKKRKRKRKCQASIKEKSSLFLWGVCKYWKHWAPWNNLCNTHSAVRANFQDIFSSNFPPIFCFLYLFYQQLLRDSISNNKLGLPMLNVKSTIFSFINIWELSCFLSLSNRFLFKYTLKNVMIIALTVIHILSMPIQLVSELGGPLATCLKASPPLREASYRVVIQCT